MLVDINLLPKKEYKNRANLMMGLIITLVALIGFLLVFLQLNKANATEEDLQSQLATIQAARMAAEQEGTVTNHSSSVLQLQRTAEWADAYFVETVPILNHVTELLPERGFVQTFSYSDAGVVSLHVQFDTNTEVAHYLASLNDSPHFESVKLFTVSTSPLTEDIEAENEDEQNNEANDEANEENKDVLSPKNAAETDENNNVLPRYFAQFELTINKEAFNSLQKEGN